MHEQGYRAAFVSERFAMRVGAYKFHRGTLEKAVSMMPYYEFRAVAVGPLIVLLPTRRAARAAKYVRRAHEAAGRV